MCANCTTRKAPRFRPDKERGGHLCNACWVHRKLAAEQKDRPPYMWDVPRRASAGGARACQVPAQALLPEQAAADEGTAQSKRCEPWLC